MDEAMADDGDPFAYYWDALATGFGDTGIAALERRADATLATTKFLRELHDPDFTQSADGDWAAGIVRIADAMGVKGLLAGMLTAGEAA